MVSSRQAIACILLVFGVAISIQSQTVPAKGPTATISGKVTVKGKGVPGLVVMLRSLNAARQNGAYKGVTDEQGNYVISNVSPGNYQAVPIAPAFVYTDDQTATKNLIINKDETIENIDFTLIRGGVITGKVTDSEGHPLIEEGIALYSVGSNTVGWNQGYFMRPTTRTDDRGIYRIFGVQPGRYRVSAGQTQSWGRQSASYKQAFYPGASEMSEAGVIEVTEGSEVTDVDITLRRMLNKFSARGRIVDGETGRPLANVPYGLQFYWDENSTSSTSTGVVSNADGEFHFDNLSPGKYAVMIDRPADVDWRADFVRFDVTDRDVTGLVVKTWKGGSVSGVVVLEGTDDKAAQAAAKRIRLQAYVANGNRMSSQGQSTTVNPDGSFRMGGLSAGLVNFGSDQDRFRIVRIEREGVVYPKGIEINDREQINGVRVIVNYGNGTVRGQVKLENGTLPQNAVIYVSMQRIDETPNPFSGPREDVQTDARGQFLKEGLIPGTYEVSAVVYTRDGRVAPPQAKQQIVVLDGSSTEVILTVDLSSTSRKP